MPFIYLKVHLFERIQVTMPFIYLKVHLFVGIQYVSMLFLYLKVHLFKGYKSQCHFLISKFIYLKDTNHNAISLFQSSFIWRDTSHNAIYLLIIIIKLYFVHKEMVFINLIMCGDTRHHPQSCNPILARKSSSKPNNVRNRSIIVSFGTNPLN